MIPALLMAAGIVSGPAAALPARETAVLQRVPVAGTDRQLGMGIAIFPPRSSKPHQRATGPETCYVLEGSVEVQIDGQPPRSYGRGETFQLPASVAHRTTAGAAGATLLVAWVSRPGVQFNEPLPN